MLAISFFSFDTFVLLSPKPKPNPNPNPNANPNPNQNSPGKQNYYSFKKKGNGRWNTARKEAKQQKIKIKRT